MNTVQVLEQAKAALNEERKWGKADLVACNTGQVCAMGALRVGAGCTVEQNAHGSWYLAYPFEELRPTNEALKALAADDLYQEMDALWDRYDRAQNDFERDLMVPADYLKLAARKLAASLLGDERVSVVRFNDHPQTTYQQVLEVFDLAIDMARTDEEKGNK